MKSFTYLYIYHCFFIIKSFTYLYMLAFDFEYFAVRDIHLSAEFSKARISRKQKVDISVFSYGLKVHVLIMASWLLLTGKSTAFIDFVRKNGEKMAFDYCLHLMRNPHSAIALARPQRNGLIWHWHPNLIMKLRNRQVTSPNHYKN